MKPDRTNLNIHRERVESHRTNESNSAGEGVHQIVILVHPKTLIRNWIEFLVTHVAFLTLKQFELTLLHYLQLG